MRYIIYSRVSTTYQDTQAQIAGCLDYIKTINHDNSEIVYFDEEELTTRYPMEDRPQLMDMLEFVRKGDMLVIYALDRLARTDEEQIDIYKNYLIGKGVYVYVLTLPNLDIQDIALHGWLSQRERTQASVRTKTTLKYKQDSFEKVGAVWYGFKLDENILQTRERLRTTGKPYKLIPDPIEYPICLMMIYMREQHMTFEEIANWLNASGYLTREGKPFLRMSVYRIVRRKERYDLDLFPQALHPFLQSRQLCAV